MLNVRDKSLRMICTVQNRQVINTIPEFSMAHNMLSLKRIMIALMNPNNELELTTILVHGET